MSHRPPPITMQKHNNNIIQLRCSTIIDFSSRFSLRVLCRSAYMASHCSEEFINSCVMLCLIDTKSSITFLALPENSLSTQYLNSHGSATKGHAKNLLPASEPDQQQFKIGHKSWWGAASCRRARRRAAGLRGGDLLGKTSTMRRSATRRAARDRDVPSC
jgi:hypothetical protein